MNDKTALSGNLNFIGLADVFQILGGNSSTGILRITNQYTPNPGEIYFVNGNPVNATNEPQHGIDAVYSLFGWTEGRFEFHEKTIQVKQEIKHSRMEIVLDALRMVDDGVIEKVGPPSLDKTPIIQKDGAKYISGESLPIIKGPFTDYSYVVNEEGFRDGENIVKAGKYGKWIWVILEGMVDVTREMAGGESMTVARLGQGSYIGTFGALLFEKYSRSSSVTAIGDVWLGLLDTERLAREYTSLSPEFKGLLLSLDNRLKKITDKAVGLYTKEKESILLTKDMGEIIEKGSSKQEVFTITEGTAYLVGQSAKGIIPLLTLDKDDVFGNVPFLDIGHEPRSAAVLSSKDLKVNALDTGSLQKEYDQLSGTLKNLINNVTTCISISTRLVHHLKDSGSPAKQ
ncbi:MAG: DUF4388 domain-containing protein [Deltaproteobacteria bacterium]|nr:DUF4388 domain-containing protein [Deltaproteobacteria bacterium]